MSTFDTEGLETSLTTEEMSTEETINVLAETVEQQQQQIDELQNEIEQLRGDTEERGDDLDQERAERAKADAEIKQRLTDAENRIEDVETTVDGGSTDTTPTPHADTSDLTEPQSPLEDLVTVPQSILDEESANTQRAVFVATDATEYTRSVPAGRMITSHELRTVLKAGTECSGHTQTVSRVMDLLNDLGGKDTKIVERDGKRRLVFSEDLINRLETLSAERRAPSHRCDRGEV